METSVPLDEVLMQFLYRAPVGLLQVATDGEVELINPMAAQLLMPLSRDGRLDNLFDVLASVFPDLRARVDACTVASGAIFEGLHLDVSSQAGRAEIYSLGAIRLDEARLMCVVEDVSASVRDQRRAVESRLRAAARVDALTQMPNLVALMERVDAATTPGTRGRDLSMLLLGCERLPQLETTFGHGVKDEVLGIMAQRLRAELRSAGRGDQDDCGDFVARGNDDAFVVLVEGADGEAALAKTARRLLDVLNRPYGVGPHQIHCVMSVGIVPALCAGDDATGLLRDAHVALAEARRAGGAGWAVFEPAMRERALRRVGIEMALREALAHEQLFVVYQPVVCLADGADRPRTVGVEALVRWRHPQRGIVAPLEFIGVAEETGLIGPLGRFVLETACRRFMAWSRALGDEAPQRLAVNLSRGQLADASFVATVNATLVACGMPPSRLQLEVTESLAAQDDAVRAQLHALKALGVLIALDDFGTGFSSLSSLHLLPVDTLKIDRSFVTLLASSPHHRVLIEATLLVARSLGLSTVAEGVETSAQAELLARLGCDKAQGYWYGRPLEDEALQAWLVERAPTSVTA